MNGEGVTLVSEEPRRGGPGEGPAHHFWKGNDCGYGAALNRVRRARGRAADQPCRDCEAPAFRWVLAGGGTHDQEGRVYSLDPDDYVPLCARCHRIGKNA